MPFWDKLLQRHSIYDLSPYLRTFYLIKHQTDEDFFPCACLAPILEKKNLKNRKLQIENIGLFKIIKKEAQIHCKAIE